MYDIQAALCDEHRRELIGGSTIDPDVIAERGYLTIGRPGANDDRPRQDLKAKGIPAWAIAEDYYFPGLLVPTWGPSGRLTSHQFKPRQPVANRDGKRMKYASAKGSTATLDVHPRWSRDRGTEDAALLPYIKDVTTPLFITEGVKKADAMTSRGLCTVALSGVFNWRNSLGILGDWEEVPLKDRAVIVVFDSDATTKKQVLLAMRRLGRWLKSRGAAVGYFVPPTTGQDKTGIDDWFAAGHTVEEMGALTLTRPPELITFSEDRFTDAALAEEVARDTLEGRYIHTTGLGWLQYTGQRWAAVDKGVPRETIRQYVRSEYLASIDRRREALARSDGPAAEQAQLDETGWLKYQNLTRIDALLNLAKDIEDIARSADDLDTDPDVLNTPSGLLHLDTLHLEPHSPEHLITRITAVDYLPDATSRKFDAALTAIPDGADTYLQYRLGQAITGHTPDDDKMVMLTGGGNNGKTLLMTIITGALGDITGGTGYALLIASELLLSSSQKGAATPEKMDLRGVRLAYMEETPEDRYLSVNTLKQVVGTPVLKGRALYKDQVSWKASHGIFLNTNHPPRVVETDNGAWRRLQRIDFPYRFRPVAAGGVTMDDLGEWRADDRRGDNTLKLAATTGEPELLRAALRWLVEGAHTWYSNREAGLGLLNIPEAIRAATRQWRQESDYIWGFIQARMEVEPGAWVSSEDFYDEFCAWIETQTRSGSKVTPDLKTVMSRLKAHTGLGVRLSFGMKRAGQAGRSERPKTGWLSDDRKGVVTKKQMNAITGLRFATPESADTWPDQG